MNECNKVILKYKPTSMLIFTELIKIAIHIEAGFKRNYVYSLNDKTFNYNLNGKTFTLKRNDVYSLNDMTFFPSAI